MIRHNIVAFGIAFLSMLMLSGCETTRNQPVYVAPGATIALADTPETRAPVTILISIDGLHPDYLQRGVTPNLNRLASQGAFAPMRPAFPTKTFPNHWTLVTGKRPDTHGIVGNRMQDVARPGETFTMANKDPFWWDSAEPIWVSAQEQGIRTATMFWPGSEVAFDGVRPADWWPFNQDLDNARRVRAVIDWMRRPTATRPKLVTLYFDTIDSAGHFYGPGPGDKLHAAIAEVDGVIGALSAELQNLNQPANIIIVSDHGMTETSPERVISLDALLPRDQYRTVELGNYAGIEPIDGQYETVKAALLTPHDHMTCWERENIPARFQYGRNPRVPAIFCLPETGWLVYQDVPAWLTGIGGGHGYDHNHPDMQAVFIAHGPGFAKTAAMPVFDNVHIYSLVAKLTGITPLANEGDLSVFAETLKQ